jgi:hypothetical protein
MYRLYVQFNDNSFLQGHSFIKIFLLPESLLCSWTQTCSTMFTYWWIGSGKFYCYTVSGQIDRGKMGILQLEISFNKTFVIKEG